MRHATALLCAFLSLTACSRLLLDRGCGDGVIDQDLGEECDDGNISDTDACLNSCREAICGDEVLRAETEICDDGNNDPGDGCAPDCQLEFVCGDGRLDPIGEGCDDANQNNNDGCSSVCQVEPGFACDDSRPTVCESICGDGLVVAEEGCDDAGQTNGDGCNDACQVETGFACEGEPSACAVLCGDGLLLAPEQCDDGNANNGDGCNEECQIDVDALVDCAAPFEPGSFPTVAAAIGSLGGATQNKIVGILPGTCNESVTLTNLDNFQLVGLSTPFTPPAIEGNALAALTIDNNQARPTSIRNLRLSSANDNGGTVIARGQALVLLSQVAVQNREGEDVGSLNNLDATAIDCQGNQNSAVLIDQSAVFNSPGGGLRVRGNARVIITNTLLFRNGNGNLIGDSERGGLSVKEGGILAGAFLVLDGNEITGNNDPAMDCQDGGVGFLNSSIIFNNNGVAQVDSECQLTAVNQFNTTEFLAGEGNVNVDPLFVDPRLENIRGYQLSPASPLIGTGLPALIRPLLPFDPEAIFGFDPLSHDVFGSPRSQTFPDPGIFEVQDP